MYDDRKLKIYNRVYDVLTYDYQLKMSTSQEEFTLKPHYDIAYKYVSTCKDDDELLRAIMQFILHIFINQKILEDDNIDNRPIASQSIDGVSVSYAELYPNNKIASSLISSYGYSPYMSNFLEYVKRYHVTPLLTSFVTKNNKGGMYGY